MCIKFSKLTGEVFVWFVYEDILSENIVIDEKGINYTTKLTKT